MQIFNSYFELTAANNARTSSQNVMSYFETDNTIDGAVDAVESMPDASLIYDSALESIRHRTPGSEGILEDPKVQDAREKIEDGTEDAAKELKDADAKEEFRQTASPDFPEKMGKVHDVNKTVREGMHGLKTARRNKDIPIPREVEQAAWEVQKYAKQASETSPSQYTPKRHSKDRTERIAKDLERQSRPRIWE